MDISSLVGGLAKTVLGVATGGLSTSILGIVESVVGNDLPPEKKAELKSKIESETTKREANAHKAANDAERNLTNRISLLEGTAKELMALPVVGRVVIFARGIQRPAWGFGVGYLDLMVFSSKWPIEPNSMQDTAFLIINFLVLGFLFGERAIKNLGPLIAQIMASRKVG